MQTANWVILFDNKNMKAILEMVKRVSKSLEQRSIFLNKIYGYTLRCIYYQKTISR